MSNYEMELMVAHKERMSRFNSITPPLKKDADELLALITAQADKITNLENDLFGLHNKVLKMDLIVEEMKRHWIAETIDSDQPEKPTGKEVALRVCKAHGITMDELCSDQRHKKLVLARHEAMLAMSEETALSVTQIGRILNRDHTSVLHGVRSLKKKIANGHKPLAMPEQT